jgi:hypothetical protein
MGSRPPYYSPMSHDSSLSKPNVLQWNLNFHGKASTSCITIKTDLTDAVTFNVDYILELVLSTDKVQHYMSFVLSDYVKDLRQRHKDAFLSLKYSIDKKDEKKMYSPLVSHKLQVVS